MQKQDARLGVSTAPSLDLSTIPDHILGDLVETVVFNFEPDRLLAALKSARRARAEREQDSSSTLS